MAMTAAQKRAFVDRMARARASRPATKTTALAVVPTASRVTYLAPPPKASPPKSLARRVGSAAVVAAVQEKQLVATVITGAAIGYIEAEGWLQELPEIESLPIGKTGSLAVTSYLVNRFLVKDPETKKILSGITSAAAAVSSYNMGKAFALKAQAEKLLTSGGADDDLDDDGKRAGV